MFWKKIGDQTQLGLGLNIFANGETQLPKTEKTKPLKEILTTDIKKSRLNMQFLNKNENDNKKDELIKEKL